jgi:hypothetical protein
MNCLYSLSTFKNGDNSDLHPWDYGQRLNNKHQRKDNLICHSAAGEESLFFSFQVKKEILRTSSSG